MRRAPVAPNATPPVVQSVDTPTEEAEMAARAQQFARLPAGERLAIEQMADQRYWRKVGAPVQARPTQGAPGELWMRTRDEVLRDRNRLDSLPAEVRAIVMPHGQRPDGQYQDALRLAGKLGEFTWDDWMLFQRRVGIPGDDLQTAERNVDAFARGRADERETLERVRGTERLYGHVVRFNEARKLGMKPEQYSRFPDYASMLAELAAAGFRTVAEYERALARYYLLFERRAGEIADVALAGSESVVQSEIARYSDPRGLARVFADLAPLRAVLDTLQGGGAGSRAPRPSLDDARAEQRRLAPRYPTLADPALDVSALGASTPEALGAALLARDRLVLANIGELRRRISLHPGRVLQLDRVRALTLGELGAEEGSVGSRLVQQHLADMVNRDRWEGEGLVWLSIGLGMVTFGSGTLVVLASAGELAIGAYQAHDEWERYEAAKAAAHSSLDPEQSLSSEDPSGVWFALALMSVAFSAASLGRALSPARRAIAVLEQTGDPAKFRAALTEARSLTPSVRSALERAGDAYADFKRAWFELAAEIGGRPMAGVDPTALFKGIKVLARHSARIGIRKFELFLETLKARRELAAVLRVSEFTAEQQKLIKAAFNQGVREYYAGLWSFEVPFSKRVRVLRPGPEGIEIDGKPWTDRDREAVIKRLGLAHADDRHGTWRDAVTQADRALDDAASGGDGVISQWASDEAMLDYYQRARAEASAGRLAPAGKGKYAVTFTAPPDVGRVFVARSRLPKGATILDSAPVAGKAVTTIAPNRVLAAFERGKDGYEISSIYPLYEP
jgi:hypothetical protein